ncbi:MAG: hypothetical protein Q7K16_01270 [Candidatus Azambacteria bacterium]|nr:hypothetical protein [Candidatus Azambacteria bacterium]
MKHLGPASKKVLLLLEAGVVLSLTRRPDHYFRILKKVSKEWHKINERYLRETIKRLYQSKLVDYRENRDGTVVLTLSEKGKNKILKYDLDKIEIKKPTRWDKLWRLVVFDIPEEKRSGRMALAAKLKELGFYPMQKSVFVHPYECKNEIDFVVEMFNIAPYVRFLRVKDIDIELDLKERFRL